MSTADVTGLPLQQQAIRARCFHPSGAFVEFRKEEIEQSIPSRFEQQVDKYPHQLAIKSASQELTYSDLNKAVNRVARAIVGLRGERTEPVALLIEHGPAAIVAILGVLKAGRFYVPLEPSYPQPRLTYMLEDSQAPLIVTNKQNLSLAKTLAQDMCQLLNVDEIDHYVSDENPRHSISPDDICLITYTSGSAGPPKGVIQNHRNRLHDCMVVTNRLHIQAEDRLAPFYSFSADMGQKAVFLALVNGATICPFDLKSEGISELADWLIKEGITIYDSSPSLFRVFIDTMATEREFAKLRLVRLTTETVHKSDVEGYKQAFTKNCILAVSLGSTEVGAYRYYLLDKDTLVAGNNVPVGYELEDMKVLVLDDNGEEVGFGEVGEIVVRSPYLSPGYWQRPDLTKKAFLPDPNDGDQRIYPTGDLGLRLPDGCLVHMGRKDSQVKIRGNRVELAEIETALLRLDSVQEAVVVAQEDPSGDRRIVAYLVANDGPPPSSAALRKSLRQRLPTHMVPSAFVTLDALPILPSGKVDRRLLPALHSSRPEGEAAAAAPTPGLIHLSPSSQEQIGLLPQNKPNGLTQRVFRALSGLVLNRTRGRK